MYVENHDTAGDAFLGYFLTELLLRFPQLVFI